MNYASKVQTGWVPWYEVDASRLALEKKAMSTRFPQFTLRMLEDKNLAWFGRLESNNNNQYEIAVVYPPDFPTSPPAVYPVTPTIEVRDRNGNRLKHQYPDGHLCLYFPSDRTFQANTTAATVVAVSAAWFFAYEYWLQSGKKEWPGPEAD